MNGTTHILPEFGLPYPGHGTDPLGYYVACPVCGERCRPTDSTSEDSVTKGAAAAYGEHFTRAAETDRT